MTTQKLHSKKAFTLVELIIVIAIIAILAVTAFLLLTKWLAKARDASRSSNLANIENSLQISLTENSSLPKPDNYTLIYASGTSNVIGYQGYFGEGVKDSVGNINSAPKDGDDYFTYYLNADLNKYQLASFMENEIAYNPNVVSAVDYSSRYINVRGDKLGLLTDANKSPLQSLGLTGLDILNTTNTYYAYLDNTTSISGTGKSLISMLSLGSKNIAKYDTGLVGYWDMETLNGNMLKDFSNYGNDLALSGTVSYEAGMRGKSTKFPKKGYFYTGNLNGITFTGSFSVGVWGFVRSQDGMATNALVSKHNWNGTRDKGFLIRQNYSNGNQLIVGSDSQSSRFRSSTIFFDRFTYFTVVFDDENNLLKYYENGLLIKQQAVTISPDNPTEPFMIGNTYVTSFNEAMNGLIDEVRVYNKALSDDEVKALYKAN